MSKRKKLNVWQEEQLDNNLEALIIKAKGSLQAEADGYIKLGDNGFNNYGEDEALAEQALRIKTADIERYGKLPYSNAYSNGNSDSVTAEQKRNRMLIMEGKLPQDNELPYDSFRGKDVNNSVEGIAGNFDKTSEARIQRTAGAVNDPLLDIDNMTINDGENTSILERKGGMTEYLSEGGFNQLYGEWKDILDKENRNGRNLYPVKTDKYTFNNFLSDILWTASVENSGK